MGTKVADAGSLFGELPPFVATKQTHVAIVVRVARKYVYSIEYERGLRVTRINKEVFSTEYKPFYIAPSKTNGMVSLPKSKGGVLYDVHNAALNYIRWGAYAGMTEVARNSLLDIIQGRAMEDDLEVRVAEQEKDGILPTISPPTRDELLKPIKTSTKNGTTESAKRPGRVTVTHPTQENTMSATTNVEKTTPTKAPAKKAAAPAKKAAAPAKKAAAPAKKAPAAEGKRGRSPSIGDDLKVTYVCDNPKREGTEAFVKFAKYKVGMTIGDVVAKGVDRGDVNYNIKRGFIKVAKAK